MSSKKVGVGFLMYSMIIVAVMHYYSVWVWIWLLLDALLVFYCYHWINICLLPSIDHTNTHHIHAAQIKSDNHLIYTIYLVFLKLQFGAVCHCITILSFSWCSCIAAQFIIANKINAYYSIDSTTHSTSRGTSTNTMYCTTSYTNWHINSSINTIYDLLSCLLSNHIYHTIRYTYDWSNTSTKRYQSYYW